MTAAQLKQLTIQLFNGYQNSSLSTAKQFIDYVFDLPGTGGDPDFQTLTVEGTSLLKGAVTCNGNFTVEATGAIDLKGTLRVRKDATFDKAIVVTEDSSFTADLLIEGGLTVNTASSFGATVTFNGPGHFLSTVHIDNTLQVDNEITTNTGMTIDVDTGTSIQLGSDANIKIARAQAGSGGELYFLNSNSESTVMVAAGSGDGSGTTILGNAGDKLGFFNGTAAVRQTLPAAAPADATAMIAEWQDFKTKIQNMNFFHLT